MKICHMTSAHPNQDKRIFYKECLSLSKYGYNTFIIAQGDTFENQGIHIIGVPKAKHGRLERVLVTSRRVYVEALKLDADIYHIHDPELLPYAIKLKKRGKSVIFDSHEDFFTVAEESDYIPKILRGMVSKLVQMFLVKASSIVDAVISVTPHICEKYKKYNNNTYMITNYPVLSTAERDGQKRILSSERKVVFAGGIGYSGNHENIIKAMSKLENVKYLLIGFGEQHYLDMLKHIDGWENVDFRGKIEYDKVKYYLEESRVGIILQNPNITTGYNIGTLGNTKIFEYMRAGLPVICTDFQLWKDIIDEYKCGIYVNPHNEEELYHAIKYLMEDFAAASEMGDNARRAIIEKYNWSTQESLLLDIYAKIGSEQRKSATKHSQLTV